MSNVTATLIVPSGNEVTSQISKPVSREGACFSKSPSLLTRVCPSTHALSTSTSAFTNGSVPGFSHRSPSHRRAASIQRFPSTVRTVAMAEENAGSRGGGIDVWLGRAAMLGFVGALGVEITTGKGVLQTVGLEAPLPSLALGLTGLVGAIIAFYVIRSTQEN